MLLAPPAPVLAEAYGLLGELRDMGDPDGAVSYFSMAAETDEASPNPWVALGSWRAPPSAGRARPALLPRA